MAASPIPSAASLSDGESASTVVLGDDPPVPVDDGLFWDINICPSDPIGWTSFGLLGPMFNSKNECKWRRLSVTQTVRMQQKVGYVFIQGLSGGFFKHDVEDQVQFEGNVTVYRLVHKGTGHSILIRSMPKGSFVGSVFLTLEHNDTLYIKVHSNINPEKILFLHKLYHCKSMTRRDLTYMVPCREAQSRGVAQGFVVHEAFFDGPACSGALGIAQPRLSSIHQVSSDLGRFVSTMNNPDAQEQQVVTWCQRLGGMVMTPGLAVELATQIAAGPWTNAQRDRLNQAVNSVLVRNGQNTRRGLQACGNFKAYLSAGDLSALESSETSYLAKVDVITSRMLRIGLHCPAETCLGAIVSMVHHQSSDDELKTMLEDYKKALKNKKKVAPKPAVHLLQYPVDPHDLPKELLASGWDQADPAARVNVGPDDLRPLGPLRHHNKRLAKNRVPDLAMASGSGAAGGVQGMLMNMMMQQQQMFMQCMTGQGQAAELPGLHLFKPKTCGQKKQLALTDQTQPAVPKATVQQVATPQQRTVLQLPAVTSEPMNDRPVVSAQEQAQMVADATQNRKVDKGPKPKSKAKATAKAKGSTKSAPKAKAPPKPKAKGKAKAAPVPPVAVMSRGRSCTQTGAANADSELDAPSPAGMTASSESYRFIFVTKTRVHATRGLARQGLMGEPADKKDPRRTVKRERSLALPKDTPLGPLWGEVELFKLVVEKFYAFPYSMQNGVMLPLGETRVMWHGRLAVILGDEVALKNCLSFKGFLIPHTESNTALMVPHTADSIREAMHLLRTQHSVLNKSKFEALEKNLGLLYQPEGNDELHQFVTACVWPKKIQAASMTGYRLFEKRTANSGELKASASELLSVYGVVRLAVVSKFPDLSLLPPQPSFAVRSFLAACQVLDLLRRSMSEEISSYELKSAVQTHQQLRLAAHGGENYQPKMHYGGHLFQHVENHPKLLSCFCHERKHKQVKRFANAQTNHSQGTSYEKSLLEEVVLLQSTALKEDQTKQSFALVSPKSASLALTEHVKLFLGLKASEPLDVSASHDVVLKPTELCSVNDAVLVKTTCGQESVGMVWFHIEARGTLYTIWAPWLPVQGSPNTFKAMTILFPGQRRKRCCFSWRLVSSMNDQLKRGRFLRSWLAAAHEPQRHLFEASQDILTQRLRRAANRVAGSSVTQKGTLVALLPHIRFLQRMWLRKALWQEQRQAERVQVEFPGKLCDAAAPKEGFRQLRAMALFVTERLKEVGIHFPQEVLARKDPVWKKGHWISQRVDGVIRNGLITGSKGSQYEVQWSDGTVTTLPETKLKTPHLWRSGEAVEVFDLSGGIYRKALVAQNFDKTAKIKDVDAMVGRG
ncbi:unnamed protein product [Cladocopium goreaui]|uniref:Uncharacterized protein n=1 Tax=Cladocopium goreaui TaxID=2562237 RepID=A0A9P1CTV5_9DINO|nr:unnamed protein product [Cladocopium goreaui]